MMQVQEAPTPASVVPIGEVTERYGVTEDQLRYWDELGILVPNRFGGHRAYSREDLEKLGYILELKNRGYRPKEVRLLLEMQKLIERPSVSGTSLLRKMLQEAKRGEVIVRPMPDESGRSYNSTYRALERAAKAAGRKVKIGKSEDGRAMQAKIIE